MVTGSIVVKVPDRESFSINILPRLPILQLLPNREFFTPFPDFSHALPPGSAFFTSIILIYLNMLPFDGISNTRTFRRKLNRYSKAHKKYCRKYRKRTAKITGRYILFTSRLFYPAIACYILPLMLIDRHIVHYHLISFIPS